MTSNDHVTTRAGLAIGSLVLGAVLVLGFKAPDDAALATSGNDASGSGSRSTGSGSGSTGTSNGSTGSSRGSGSRAPTATPSTGGSGSSGSGSAKAGTYTGSEVDTRFGPVEVQVTVSGGKVTAITALELPSGGRSGMISSYAAPVLTQEALQAQSASIDLVSGATYTSEGYARSLQSALDQAGL